MPKILILSAMLVGVWSLAACNAAGPDDTEERIVDVNVFLARVCQLAAACPGSSPTQEELDSCPSEIRSELSSTQVAELERFTTYTATRQQCILQCIGGAICDRFGGSILNISDSDVLEPFRACDQQCP